MMDASPIKKKVKSWEQKKMIAALGTPLWVAIHPNDFMLTVIPAPICSTLHTFDTFS